ncbi:hypothetical protein SCE1572_38515 [Sorangium cellulosum So0157-2]|uniref:Uncharacterized protein n=1 Tax=Sorangium cellulosum So0157-2 TaxID=1254432 RepID=S4Y6M1_SORCE|nr:hypothetical protein SCE1572_38515 [Sorangium cellulosum So0157-2]
MTCSPTTAAVLSGMARRNTIGSGSLGIASSGAWSSGSSSTSSSSRRPPGPPNGQGKPGIGPPGNRNGLFGRRGRPLAGTTLIRIGAAVSRLPFRPIVGPGIV